MVNDGTRGTRVALCASCDRCRARKTKCDGNRPCGNCANKYMKKHRLSSIAGIDISLFECVYSPAKRRGPVPGKASQARKAEEMDRGMGGLKGNKSNLLSMGMGGFGNMNMNMGPTGASADNMFGQQQQIAALMGNQNGLGVGMDGGMGMNQHQSGGGGMNDSLALQQQLLMQQQQQQMRMQGLGMDPNGLGGLGGPGGFDNGMNQQNLMFQQQQLMMQQMQNQNKPVGPQGMSGQLSNVHPNGDGTSAPPAQRLRKDEAPPENIGVGKSVTKHISLLEKSSVFGNRLRSHYTLSIDTLFNLPPVPSNEEYCAQLNANMTPAMLPPFDVAALNAARFAEIALGALVSNQIPLALELSNAAVVCLKQCVEEPIHPSCMFDVAKAYFLHGMFRSYRGDLERYFKYRRVCLSKLSQLGKKVVGIQQILAAISFHDSLAYMIYNANAEDLPDIDKTIPELSICGRASLNSEAERKYQTSTDHSKIASDPMNQMWIQGPPRVFINNEAPPLSRALDALACAVRSCCDHANERFTGLGSNGTNGMAGLSPTARAVNHNVNELCSRNMILSAFTLLEQSENTNRSEKNHGLHLVISAMDAFLEEGDENGCGGFTDSQIQSLLNACNVVIGHPHLLYQGGVTYHMVTNAAILLCHLLNGLHSERENFDEVKSIVFDEVLDTYLAVRKLLHAHRRKLPVLLRCHGLPRPNLVQCKTVDGKEEAFVDLGETQMCSSRGCQGFVLMACSPCVAAERAQAAERARKENMGTSTETKNIEDLGAGFDTTLNSLGEELALDDDELLGVLGKIVAA